MTWFRKKALEPKGSARDERSPSVDGTDLRPVVDAATVAASAAGSPALAEHAAPQALRRALPWEAHVGGELARIAWPVTVSMLSYATMTLVGTLFVARLGASALAGVGLGGTFAFVLLGFSFGLLRGSKTLVAQAVGAGSTKDVAAYRAASVVLGVGLGVVTAAVGYAVAGLVAQSSATPEAAAATATYLRLRILGAPLVLLYTALREARYGEGEARWPMFASVAGNAVNAAVDAWLLLGLDFGVEGAAYGAIAGHAVEAAVMLALEARRGLALGLVRLETLRATLHIGGPTGIQFVLESGAFAIVASLIASYGEVEIAAHQIALQVLHFAFLPAFAVAESAAVLAGQAKGAVRTELVRRVTGVALVATGAYGLCCALAIYVFVDAVLASFGAGPDVSARAAQLLFVAMFFQLGDGANIVARAVLRGIGDVRFPAVVGIIASWVCTPPLTYLLGERLGMGAFGAWLGLTLEVAVSTVICGVRLDRMTRTHAAAAVTLDVAVARS